MPSADFLTLDAIGLDLPARSRDEALSALIDLLGLPDRTRATLLRLLVQRESLGSTGVGHAVAIPHCRSLVVPRVRIAYGRLQTPLEWSSPDGKAVQHLFLIVAPLVEVSSQYLPTLGRLARAARTPEFRALLERVRSPDQLREGLGSSAP